MNKNNIYATIEIDDDLLVLDDFNTELVIKRGLARSIAQQLENKLDIVSHNDFTKNSTKFSTEITILPTEEYERILKKIKEYEILQANVQSFYAPQINPVLTNRKNRI